MNGAASGTGAAPNIKVKGPVRAPPRACPAASARHRPRVPAAAPTAAPAPSPLIISSGTNYQPTSLGAQASAVYKHLTHSTQSSAQPGPTPAPTASQASLFPDLQACLNRKSNGQRPLLVDLAHYLGHPALIAVLPATNGAQPEALVIAPGCTTTAKAPLPR